MDEQTPGTVVDGIGRGEVVVGGSAEPLVVERQRTYHPGAPHTAD